MPQDIDQGEPFPPDEEGDLPDRRPRERPDSHGITPTLRERLSAGRDPALDAGLWDD
jgi:hypothetical protein